MFINNHGYLYQYCIFILFIQNNVTKQNTIAAQVKLSIKIPLEVHLATYSEKKNIILSTKILDRFFVWKRKQLHK
jgi:hypothetical protein